jgi:hypothetical protein
MKSRAWQEKEEEEEEELQVPFPHGSIRIAKLLVPAIHSLAFKDIVTYLEFLAHRRAVSTAGLHRHVFLNSVFFPQLFGVYGSFVRAAVQKLIGDMSCDVKHARGKMSRSYFDGLRTFVRKVDYTLHDWQL